MNSFSKRLSKYLPIIVIILATIPTITPLFRSGFFTMHDDQQIIRLAELDLALKDGQFPVRWVKNLGFGYGYPLFIFYPPLVYYLGEIFHIATTASYITSIKLVFASAFITSALTMYFWAKAHTDKWSGTLAALFYTLVPYKAVDAYVRGALAELFTFVWLPLILLSIDKLIASDKTKVNNIWAITFSLSIAALIITHSLIALPFSIIAIIYTLFRVSKLGPTSLVFTKLVQLASFGFLGILMSSFFWMPSLAEKQFTLVDNILLAERYTYSQHFVEPTQLWNSLWGYGGSSPDSLDGFSLKIGKLHIAMVALTPFMLIVSKFFQKKHFSSNIALTTTSLFLLSAFMTTNLSSFIWSTFRPLQFLQFPWRFLTFTALFSSFTAGLVFHQIQHHLKNKLLLGIIFCTIFTLLALPNYKLFKPQTYLNVKDSHYTSDEFAKWKISKTSFEFVPKQVTTRIEPPLNITQLDINQDQIASKMLTTTGQPLTKIYQDKVHRKQLVVSTTEPTQITFNTFDFPGWSLYVDMKPVEIDNQNKLHLISVNLETGDYQIDLIFKNTPIRSLANSLSLVGLLITIGLATMLVVHGKSN